MDQVKRWAFVPLLLLVSALLACRLVDHGRATALGVGIGLVASVPLAVLVDRRRNRRRSTS
jgi:hypothetical protein